MFGKRTNGVFPVQRSLLSAPALLKEVAKRYQLGSDCRCELMEEGLNDHYLIRSPHEDYMLRVYGAGRSEADIFWELGLLHHLRAHGAPVAQAVPTAAANWFCIVAAPEGKRYAVLFDFAQGHESRRQDFSPAQARFFGHALASIHNAAAGYESDHQRAGLDLYALLYNPLKVLEPRLAHRPDDAAYVRGLVDRLREEIIELDNNGLSHGICHGDAAGGNVHVDEFGEFTFFDFDRAGPGWPAYDLATYRWGLQKSLPILQTDVGWYAFMEGYRESARLTTADEQSCAAFVATREIWHMGTQTANGPDLGFNRLHDDYFDSSIQFLKDWESRHLTTGV